MINTVIIGGFITKDIDLKYLSNGTAIIQFSIANNRVWMKDGEKKEDVSFINLKAFGKTAENINQYFKKGSPILVEGRLQVDQWTQEDGQKRSWTYVLVNRFYFVGGKKVEKQDKQELSVQETQREDIQWEEG